MRTKRRNEQDFSAEVNGTMYHFTCYTTDTRNGFCHTVMGYYYTEQGSFVNLSDTKCSYTNRAWESFDYETALHRAIGKCPKADQAALYETIIEHRAKEEHERCEQFVQAFTNMYESLNDENKQHLSKIAGHIETEEQARGVMLVGSLMSIMQ